MVAWVQFLIEINNLSSYLCLSTVLTIQCLLFTGKSYMYNSANRSLYGRYLMNTLLGMVYL